VSAALAVRGGLVVAPDGAREADVLIDEGRIVAVSAPGTEPASAEIDARGCVVLPGAVDAHVHVGLDYRLMNGTETTSADSYEDASRAAAAGGTTTIIDFAMQVEGEGLLEPLERRLRDIEPSAVDVALHCWMLEANREALAEIPELVARGVPSLKVFLAYSQLGEPMEEEDMLTVWKAVAAAGGIMQAHCESWPIIRPRLLAAFAEGVTGYAGFAASRPPLSEADAVGRALALAGASGAETYCVHLSTLGAVQHLRLARMHGLEVHGEACPHHLLLDESEYLGERPGDFVMSPPLRTAEHRAALWAALIDGTIEVAAADHAAWPAPVKAPGRGYLEAVHGAAGNGLLLPLLAAQVGVVEGFGWEHVARLTAANPARIFRLPAKGALAPGRDADLVVLHPADVAPVPQVPPYWRVGNGIFRGLPHVPPRVVMQRGRVLARAGEFVGEDAAGRFVAAAT
jgi:dihydropyrimidinase